MNLKTHYQVGSADDADIVIKQTTVSKRHCELKWTEEAGWELRDLDSTNGTFVDGNRITDVCKVNSSNKITLGRGVELNLPPRPSPKTKPEPPLSELHQPSFRKPKPKVAASYLGLLSVGLTALTVGFGLFVFANRNKPVKREQSRLSENIELRLDKHPAET